MKIKSIVILLLFSVVGYSQSDLDRIRLNALERKVAQDHGELADYLGKDCIQHDNGCVPDWPAVLIYRHSIIDVARIVIEDQYLIPPVSHREYLQIMKRSIKQALCEEYGYIAVTHDTVRNPDTGEIHKFWLSNKVGTRVPLDHIDWIEVK